EFSQGIIDHGQQFSWAATSRADQIAPLEDDILEVIARAGLRKVIIGAESGSQEMLDLMKKDTLAGEALISAEKLARHRIGATFNFIVGFPEEVFENTQKTLRLIKEIKRINPEFEFSVFFYTPYPGTELFHYIVSKGYRVPSTLQEWSNIDFITYAGYWINDEERRYVDRFKFYTKLGTEQSYRRGWTRPLHHLAAYRARNDYFRFPVEQELVNFVRYKLLRHSNW
ncbi:MAG: hypothetical protein OEM41_07700, partial [Ignavibacteria bacterium]|nr:hypothetical protein [Ignavibacteria bacterium]